MKELCYERAKGAAGHDDWALGSKGPARTDRDCRGNRLQKRHLGFNPASVQQNGFDRFGNAMTANALGAVLRHDANDQRPNDRNEDAVNAKMIADRRDQCTAQSSEIEDIREESDQTEQG